MNTIQNFFYNLFFTNYFAGILAIWIVWGGVLYFRKFPKVIRIVLLDKKDNLIDFYKFFSFYYAVNGNKKETGKKIEANPYCIRKWFYTSERAEIIIKHEKEKGGSLYKQKIKLLEKLTFFDFTFDDDELHSLKKETIKEEKVQPAKKV